MPPRTLLLVGEDSMVRALEAQILRLQGYLVLEGESAAAGLRVAEEAAAIHLLIMDLPLSERQGLRLTRQFRALQPESALLLVLGSAALLNARKRPDLDHFDLLVKPFYLDELLHKVRVLLEVGGASHVRKPWCCD